MRSTFRPDSGRFTRAKCQVRIHHSANNLPFRIVQIGGDKDLNPLPVFAAVAKAFPEFYEKLVRCEPLRCQYTGTTFPALRSPTLVVLDVRSLPIIDLRLA